MNKTQEQLNWLGDDLRLEVSEAYHVRSLERLTIGDITHLATLSEVLSGDDRDFIDWWLGSLHHELQRRKSEGKIEKGLNPLPIPNYTDRQLTQICQRLDLLRDFETLTREERAFVVELHRKVTQAISARLLQKKDSDITLLTPREVCEKCQMSRGQVAKAVKDGLLPKPKKISQRLFRWVSTEVTEALQNLN